MAGARRLALIGARADFTRGVLAGLLVAGLRPALMVLAAPRSASFLPVETRHAVDALAKANRIEVATVRGGEQALRVCASRGADLALMACFPWRLPVESTAVPPAGVFNLHPSPLPAFRGPTPLFWQFRAGVERTAITLHRVDAAFDEGPVLGHAALPLPAEARYAEVSERLTSMGAMLAAAHLGDGGDIPPGTPQDTARASYFGFPGADAFTLSRRWSAERVYRFVHAISAWGRPFALDDAGVDYRVFDARGFEPHAVQARSLIGGRGDRLWVACSPGVVELTGRRAERSAS